MQIIGFHILFQTKMEKMCEFLSSISGLKPACFANIDEIPFDQYICKILSHWAKSYKRIIPWILLQDEKEGSGFWLQVQGGSLPASPSHSWRIWQFTFIS